MTTTLQPDQSQSVWEKFREFTANTNNFIYIGWFSIKVIPTLLATTTCFINPVVAVPLVDIDSTPKLLPTSLRYRTMKLLSLPQAYSNSNTQQGQQGQQDPNDTPKKP